MKNLTFLLFLSSLFFSCSSNEATYKNAICITHINTIDAKGGLSSDMTVIVQDERIIKIGKSSDIKLDATNTILDGKGKYLIPGLWDAHVHFAYIEELAPSMFDLFLGYGITSVRDTGGKLDFVKKWKDRALANPTDAPRVKIAGPLLDGMPNVYDGSSPSRPQLSVGAGSVEEAIQIVENLEKQKVDLIKAYEMLTPEQFVAVTKLAKEKGLKVTGHVPLSMDVISASNAGLNSMEHLRNLEFSTAANANELLENRKKMLATGANDQGGVLRSRIHASQRTSAVNNQDETNTQKVINVLAKNQTWQIPTMALMANSIKRHTSRSDWKASFKYLPEAVEKKWMDGTNTLSSSEIKESDQQYVGWAMGIIKKINNAEIGIMAGTDCPIFFLTPGLSLHEELALLVEAGLTPLEAIEAATLKPAEYFSMEKELGLIQEGYLADLVLLTANPLVNIRNTTQIDAVIRAGKYYSREKLDEKFKKLEGN